MREGTPSIDDYTFNQLVDLEQLREMLEAHSQLSGMACGLMDADGNSLVGAGWQDICTQFHRLHPVTCAYCQEKTEFIKAHLHDSQDGLLEYRCKNNMVNIAIPIVFDGRHQATFITGQFFYEDEPPDRDFFIKQAEIFDFDKNGYLAALDKVPLFSRGHIRGNLILLHNIMQLLGESGLKNVSLAREMKERRQVERSAGLLSFALDNVREAVFLIDEHARFHAVNEEACRILGYSRDTLLTMNVGDIDPGWSEHWAVHWQVLKERKSLTFERYHQTKDGWIFPVEINANFFEYDKHQYNLALVRDITERKQIEQALELREREYRSLVEHSPDLVVRYDTNLQRTYVNPAWEKASGHSADEVIGIPADKASEMLQPLPPKYMAILRQVLEEGTRQTVDTSWMNARGEMLYMDCIALPEFDQEGTVASLLSVCRDITERKRAEQALSESQALLDAVVNSTDDMIWAVDSEEFHLLSFNRSFRDFFLHERGVWLERDMNHKDRLKDTALAARWHSFYQRALQNGPFSVEYPLSTGSRVFEMNFNLLKHGDVVFGISVFGREITGLKQAKASLRVKTEELNRTNIELRKWIAHSEAIREQERARIARDLHDELGQFLTALRINLSMLSRHAGNKDEHLLNDIAYLQDLVGECIKMAHDLVSELRPATLDFGLAASLEELTQGFSQSTGIQCTLRFIDWRDDSLDEASMVSLYRITQESLTNVARHACTDQVTITLKGDRHSCTMIIRDKGVGFDPEHKKNDSFGLIGMRERVETLGGSLTINSIVDQGTELLLRIPATDTTDLENVPS